MSTSDDERSIRNTCNVCGKQFNYVSNLKNHLLVHTGDLPYQCKTCGKSFREKGSLKLHERTHTGEKPYSCVKCEKSFSTMSSLKMHNVIHTGEKPHTCDKCGKSFSRKAELKNHIHVHDEENPFKCDKCGKSFSTKSYFKNHIRTHTGENLFLCEKCGRSYKQKAVFRQHKCTHNGKEIYYCEKCNILFKSKDILKLHNYVHSACDKSNVTTSQVTHLKISDPIEKTVRPYCGKCGESYSDMGSFREHNCSTYKVNELYSCDKCDNSFESKNILNDHYHTHTIPVSHTDNTYTNSFTSQEYFSDNDREPKIKVEEYLEDVSDPLSVKEEYIKDEIFI